MKLWQLMLACICLVSFNHAMASEGEEKSPCSDEWASIGPETLENGNYSWKATDETYRKIVAGKKWTIIMSFQGKRSERELRFSTSGCVAKAAVLTSNFGDTPVSIPWVPVAFYSGPNSDRVPHSDGRETSVIARSGYDDVSRALTISICIAPGSNDLSACSGDRNAPYYTIRYAGPA